MITIRFFRLIDKKPIFIFYLNPTILSSSLCTFTDYLGKKFLLSPEEALSFRLYSDEDSGYPVVVKRMLK